MAAALVVKILLGTLAFVGVLWAVRAVNPRAVGMAMTFPALNGVVLLTVTDRIVSEMVVGILPLMLLNGFLPAMFIALRSRLGARPWIALALCLLAWTVVASMLELEALWAHRRMLALAAALLVLGAASWAFFRLRAAGQHPPALSVAPSRWPDFLRERASRIFWFFVSLAIVSSVAYAFRDAHSLVGRLSALPLVPLFVLHWAVNEGRADLLELRVSALIGPLAAGAFLVLFTLSLGLIRTDAGELHPGYWPIGIAMLFAQWELTRRMILLMSALTYRR